ncbi:hypothetical protein [Collimonas sp.]|jgi:hypothetical protein|uniref:hypothetical protein n=1 Tax=Collimonas sp. TaxID=1963772 RepID=UPI002C8450A0|nr:hypothetical protein [Collimonas sp.]HWW07542.1 hypothetical protein [Collimonas sp.]
MDKVQLRRDNLRKWVATHGAPSGEKSYFSQLINGSASFGEKSARRLEREYKMGDMYLDSHDKKKIDDPSQTLSVKQKSDKENDELDDLIELAVLYRKAGNAARVRLMKYARALEGSAKRKSDDAE